MSAVKKIMDLEINRRRIINKMTIND
jgi:hypothetical protein